MADLDDGLALVDHLDEVREVRELRNRNPRVFRDRIDPFDVYSDREFRNRYRLSKESVRYVVGLVEERLMSVCNRETDISPQMQVLIALRFYAVGCYQVELGDLHGVSQATVSRIVARVSNTIAALLPQFVQFPDRVEDLMVQFHGIAGFPQVVGCIDCTHVAIKSPGQERAMLYVNRKGFYSINVQIVCDAQRRILDIVARWRGSVHDARIWDNCTLKDKFETSRIKGVLLGNAGYPCKRYLPTPFQNPRTRPEERYNAAHTQTRITVERCFGEWKNMFRALQNKMQISLATAKTAIIAMAVLYNIRQHLDDIARYDDEEVPDNTLDEEEDEEEVNPAADQPGSRVRDDFVHRYFL